MFSTLPQGVREEGWQAWESLRMQRKDFDAPTTSHDASDSEMSCISDADSCTTKKRKTAFVAQAFLRTNSTFADICPEKHGV